MLFVVPLSPVLLTGEMVYSWMGEDYAWLRELKPVAEKLAHKSDWPPLYDEAALRAVHEKIAARADKAGEAVVANAEAAAKAEVARVRRFEEQREAALAEKERRERESRAAATARQLQTLDAQLAERRSEKRRAKEADALYAGEVQARVEAARAEEQEKAAERRRAAVATRLHLEAQMEEKRRRKREQHDDAMGPQERLFNAAILDQASAVVLRGEAFD